MADVDKAFEVFLKEFEDKASRHQARSSQEERIVRAKNEVLQPMRVLLKRLMDLGLVVHHSDKFMPGRSAAEPLTPQPLDVYENQSSPLWYPGVSLFFDHPARVEIAVPNSDDKSGAVLVIRSSSEHPDAHLLHQSFKTVDEACEALSRFLAKNTVRMERAPVRPPKG